MKKFLKLRSGLPAVALLGAFSTSACSINPTIGGPEAAARNVQGHIKDIQRYSSSNHSDLRGVVDCLRSMEILTSWSANGNNPSIIAGALNVTKGGCSANPFFKSDFINARQLGYFSDDNGNPAMNDINTGAITIATKGVEARYAYVKARGPLN